jgi:hypothetical protein
MLGECPQILKAEFTLKDAYARGGAWLQKIIFPLKDTVFLVPPILSFQNGGMPIGQRGERE